MRTFDCFLYGDGTTEDIPDYENPRAVLPSVVDFVVSELLMGPPGSYSYEQLCQKVTEPVAKSLLRIGLLRQENGLYLDTPVIVREDAVYLRSCFSEFVFRMADSLEQRKQEYISLVAQIENHYPPELHLYHLLCGAVLDGRFFDCLSREQIVATSRLHPSGLDYLLVLYERTPELELLSKKLLCSYNRCSDGKRTLQSFGDAQGDRFDVFRFLCQKELGKVSPVFQKIEETWELVPGETIGEKRNKLLRELQQFWETGGCEEACYRLLLQFGYVKKGQITVPVYQKKNREVIEGLEQLTEHCIFEEMCTALRSAGRLSGLLCQTHGVSAAELANELYHIVFGQLNEELASRGFVAKPAYRPGEGRYWKSVELM